MKSKIIFILTVSLFFSIVFYQIHQTTYYKPISITIEINSDSAETCQFFYDTGNGFNENEVITKHYFKKDGFELIRFNLPAANIKKIRIDPGLRFNQYEIKKITLISGNLFLTWNPKEIRSEFKLNNLLISDSLNYSRLIIHSTNNNDPQIIYSHDISTEYRLTDHAAKRDQYLVVIIIYIIFIILIIFIGNKIINKAIYFASLCKSHLSLHLLRRNAKYYVIIIALFLFKAFLLSVQQMEVFGNFVHDDALFIKQAYTLSSGDWLGNYDCYTLIKGFIYPLFIALSFTMGIPLFFAQLLLCAFACLAIVYALSPVIKNPGLKILLFAILFFNPFSSADFTMRILRDGIYPSLALLVFASFWGMLLDRERNNRSIFRWSLLASLSLFAFWNTKEEGVFILPAIVWLLLFTIMVIVFNNKSGKLKDRFIDVSKTKYRTLLIIIIPFIFLFTGNFSIAIFNYFKYGGFVVNEIKSKPFSDAYVALTSIKPDNWKMNIPVPRDAREKAYKISPSFAELKTFLEDKDCWYYKAGEGDPDEIKGGWFVWALRDAACQAGYHNSLPQSQQFYNKVAREINSAFESGYIEKNSNLSIFVYTWDNRYIIPVFEKIKQELFLMITFKKYTPYPNVSKEDLSAFSYFQNITNEPINMAGNGKYSDYGFIKLKYKVLIIIAIIYGNINPFIFILSLFSYLFLSCLVLFTARSVGNVTKWMILTSILFILIARLMLVAYISVSQWDAVNPLYLNVIYPFLLLFEFLSIFVTIDVLKQKFKTHEPDRHPA